MRTWDDVQFVSSSPSFVIWRTYVTHLMVIVMVQHASSLPRVPTPTYLLCASSSWITPHRLVCSMEHTSSIIEDSQIALVCSMEHTNPHFGALLMQP